MAHPRDHQGRVDVWLAGVGVGVGASALVALLQSALDVLWRRAQHTLGDATVRAIASRAIVTAASRHPLLRALVVGEDGISCAELVAMVDGTEPAEGIAVDPASVREAVRGVLVELLTVLGDLTANILTTTLHEALMTVTPSGGGGNEERGRPAGSGAATTAVHGQGGGAVQRVGEDEMGETP